MGIIPTNIRASDAVYMGGCCVSLMIHSLREEGGGIDGGIEWKSLGHEEKNEISCLGLEKHTLTADVSLEEESMRRGRSSGGIVFNNTRWSSFSNEICAILHASSVMFSCILRTVYRYVYNIRLCFV